MKKLIALSLAIMMVLALCACGSSSEAPAAEAAPAADAPAAAPAAPAAPDGTEPSEEPTGEPVAELFPADGFSKDLEGYKEYAIAALQSDEHAPPEIIDSSVEAIKAVTDGNDEAFSMMLYQGRIMSYDEFLAG